MFNKTIRLFFSIFILNLILIKASNSEIITDIQIIGNDRISKETIIMFSEIWRIPIGTECNSFTLTFLNDGIW